MNQSQPFLSLAAMVSPEAAARGQQICIYYDGHNRLVGKHHRNDQNCPGSKPTTYETSGFLAAYTYDDDGNIQTMADAAAYGGSPQSFAYDTLDRLRTAQASGSTTYGGYTQRSYAYSNAGNITSFEGAALTYQNSAHKHAVTHIGGVQKYWYDANGNATRRLNGSQDVTLTYDAENRLTAMSGGVTSS